MAEPLLDAAFFRDETRRLVVTVFAYLLIVAGLFWVMMPYLLRDQLNWSTKNVRWRALQSSLFLWRAILACALTIIEMNARLSAAQTMNRILVIRGGAIGDFILTLPALKLLRDASPDARIEILGYSHIVALAENRFYAHAVRSIEYSALSRFFSDQRGASTGFADYFVGFDLVLSYLFDPDQIFEANFRRCGVDKFFFVPSEN